MTQKIEDQLFKEENLLCYFNVIFINLLVSKIVSYHVVCVNMKNKCVQSVVFILKIYEFEKKRLLN